MAKNLSLLGPQTARSFIQGADVDYHRTGHCQIPLVTGPQGILEPRFFDPFADPQSKAALSKTAQRLRSDAFRMCPTEGKPVDISGTGWTVKWKKAPFDDSHSVSLQASPEAGVQKWNLIYFGFDPDESLAHFGMKKGHDDRQVDVSYDFQIGSMAYSIGIGESWWESLQRFYKLEETLDRDTFRFFLLRQFGVANEDLQEQIAAKQALRHHFIRVSNKDLARLLELETESPDPYGEDLHEGFIELGAGRSFRLNDHTKIEVNFTKQDLEIILIAEGTAPIPSPVGPVLEWTTSRA